MTELLHNAIVASLQAGEAIMKVYASDSFEVESKSDNSPLTKADRASHEIIAAHLAKTNIPVLSEEDSKNHPYEKRKKWTRCWIVDPLDGTKEFIKRNGEFTVNIALVENGESILGVIFVPVKNELYYAEKNEGAFLSNDQNRTNIQLPCFKLPQTKTIAGSRSHTSAETEKFVREMEERSGKINFISAGSALKFCLLAKGEAHFYPRFAPTMEWDTAAGQIILEESGGKMVQWPSKEKFVYNRENLRNGWFLATAGNSH
ncbi:MAG: 3'(2'),5'-bisphosphate nucleotidase CysQ [Bacteroidetes bacterium]|nr:3'(2'),5'-bisphosphate nucleotidase CysQ [Bacteroidota bacterium]